MGRVFGVMATAVALMVAIWSVRAQQPSAAALSGEWDLVSASGTTPPEGFAMRIESSPAAVRVHSQWKEPGNGQYGLTLLGVTSPEMAFSLDGHRDLNQAGPFVVHSKTRWEGARLITEWTTSEFLGTSFEGRWVHAVAADGSELTLEIHAESSQGSRSDATLRFRRR